MPWRSDAAVPWWQRPDPYWETQLFDAQRKWRRFASGSGEFTGAEIPYPVSDPGPAERAATIPLDEVPVGEHGVLVGLLRLCGVLAAEQIAAFSGDARARGKLQRLSKAGVVECAWFHAPGAGFPRAEMWRVRHGERWAAYAQQIVSASLDRRMFCGLTPWGALPGVMHTRHQVLAAELVLRCLEAGGPWLGWLPEAVCVPDRFLPPDHPHVPQERAAAVVMAETRRRAKWPILDGVDAAADIAHVSVRADAALLRSDGTKVFLELQAQASPDSVLRKVLNWSRLIAAAPIGGTVLFVAAPKPSLCGSVVHEIKTIIEEHAAPQARSSLLVGAWEDYSPDHGELTEDCGTLRAARYDGHGWEETHAGLAHADPYLPDWSLIGRLPELAVSVPWLT